METFFCSVKDGQFVMFDGSKPRFTVIGQQEAVTPESGEIPPKAFESKTVLMTGMGDATTGGWVFSARVAEVLSLELGQVMSGISTGTT